MAILIDKSTKVICQGITGSQGTVHTQRAPAYGTTNLGDAAKTITDEVKKAA